MNESDEDVDSNEPTAEEIAQMRNATASDVQAVDVLVLGKCSTSWRKVAMVVGSSLDEYDEHFPNLPYVFIPVRMLELEKAGKLEIRGDVFAMRTSEIRLVAQLHEPNPSFNGTPGGAR